MQSILYFFAITLGLGFLTDLIVKNWKADWLEKVVMRIGVGTLLIPIVGVIFHTIRIPIYWPNVLVLAILIAGAGIWLHRKTHVADFKQFFDAIRQLKISKKQVFTILALVLFGISAHMYIQGSFNYPWFENGDPYGYALTSKYIAMTGDYGNDFYFQHYAYPYPQGYQIVMGLVHQTNDSIYWTMKFFNALIISLSILFFFYFVKRITSASIAFWSTLVLAAIPAWLGHFVFSLNFNMALMFVLFYAFFSIDQDKRWKYVAALMYGSIIINHFYTAVVITALLIIAYLLRVLVLKEFNKQHADAIVYGLAVGLAFWIPAIASNWSLMVAELGGAQLGGLDVFVPFIQKLGSSMLLAVLFFAVLASLLFAYIKHEKWFGKVKALLSKKHADYGIYLTVLITSLLVLILPSEKLLYAKGSGTRLYTWGDFFIAQNGNMINNPIGIGLVVMTLFLLGMLLFARNFKKLFTKEQLPYLIVFTWAIFSFIGVHGARLSIGFVPFRMWTFFGMALAVITGYTIYILLRSAGKLSPKPSVSLIIQLVIIVLLIGGIHQTSFSQKHWHNTAAWPEHQIMVPDSQQLYVWMRDNLPKDSLVFPLCHAPALMFGYDMVVKPWEDKSMKDRRYFESDPPLYHLSSLDQSVAENHAFLKKHGYEYTVFGASCIAKFKVDQNKVNTKLQSMLNSSLFKLERATKTEVLFRVL